MYLNYERVLVYGVSQGNLTEIKPSFEFDFAATTNEAGFVSFSFNANDIKMVNVNIRLLELKNIFLLF